MTTLVCKVALGKEETDICNLPLCNGTKYCRKHVYKHYEQLAKEEEKNQNSNKIKLDNDETKKSKSKFAKKSAKSLPKLSEKLPEKKVEVVAIPTVEVKEPVIYAPTKRDIPSDALRLTTDILSKIIYTDKIVEDKKYFQFKGPVTVSSEYFNSLLECMNMLTEAEISKSIRKKVIKKINKFDFNEKVKEEIEDVFEKNKKENLTPIIIELISKLKVPVDVVKETIPETKLEIKKTEEKKLPHIERLNALLEEDEGREITMADLEPILNDIIIDAKITDTVRNKIFEIMESRTDVDTKIGKALDALRMIEAQKKKNAKDNEDDEEVDSDMRSKKKIKSKKIMKKSKMKKDDDEEAGSEELRDEGSDMEADKQGKNNLFDVDLSDHDKISKKRSSKSESDDNVEASEVEEEEDEDVMDEDDESPKRRSESGGKKKSRSRSRSGSKKMRGRSKLKSRY